MKGGTPPYSMRVLEGRLPPGVGLVDGAISGNARMAGNYKFTIGVTDSSTPPQSVAQPMTLRVIGVSANTVLTVSPPSARIMVVGAQKPQGVRVNIGSGAQPLDWKSAVDVPWLKLVPSEGVSPTAAQIEVSAEGLATGTYVATVTITMEGAPNSPARIPVQVTVRK